MSVLTETNRLGDWLKWEEEQQYSRDKVIVASGENLKTGAVVGIITASGKVKKLNPSGNDGSETAAGVLVDAVDATAGDQPGVIIARHAICASKGLVWPDGITAPQKETAVGQLKARGILVREGA